MVLEIRFPKVVSQSDVRSVGRAASLWALQGNLRVLALWGSQGTPLSRVPRLASLRLLLPSVLSPHGASPPPLRPPSCDHGLCDYIGPLLTVQTRVFSEAASTVWVKMPCQSVMHPPSDHMIPSRHQWGGCPDPAPWTPRRSPRVGIWCPHAWGRWLHSVSTGSCRACTWAVGRGVLEVVGWPWIRSLRPEDQPEVFLGVWLNFLIYSDFFIFIFLTWIKWVQSICIKLS